jgi:hypothetical protein
MENRWERPMRRLLHFGVAAILALALSGCGDGHGRTIFVAQIVSDQQADGDIAFDGVNFTFANGPDTLFFGIDDNDPNLPEYRAFLDFPLNGSAGGDIVPLNAVIVSATLEVFVTEVSFATPIPTLLDLVEYPVTGLRAQDFSSPPLTFRTLDFFLEDQGNYVAIDVTPLMREAQRLRLSDFQVRFQMDSSLTDFGFIGLDDRPTVTLTAPLLTIEYN